MFAVPLAEIEHRLQNRVDACLRLVRLGVTSCTWKRAGGQRRNSNLDNTLLLTYSTGTAPVVPVAVAILLQLPNDLPLPKSEWQFQVVDETEDEPTGLEAATNSPRVHLS